MVFSTTTLCILGGGAAIAVIATALLFYLESSKIAIVRLFLGVLAILLLFGTMGLLLSKMHSLPIAFFLLSAISLFAGIIYNGWGDKFFPWYDRNLFIPGFVTNIVWASWATFGFTLIYDMVSAKPFLYSPYLIVGILPIMIPFVIIKAYDYWMNIPALQYRKWYYESTLTLPVLEPINVMKINIQFTKNPDELEPNFEGYWVELPSEMELGVLFHYFIFSHNNRHREYKKEPIQVAIDGKPLGWLLYKHQSSNQRVYFDTALSLNQNNILNNETIFVQSYSN